MKKLIWSSIAILTLFFLMENAAAQTVLQNKIDTAKIVLNEKAATDFARLALKCVQKEYPNKLDHVMNDSKEVLAPSVLHPAFYGCFDWHSSVHGHWMLVRILKLFPNIGVANEIRKALNENLSAENIKTEVLYLGQANRKSFERTYGWAWLLKLAEELYDWNDADGKVLSRNLKPLTDAIAQQYIDFLPRQNYPIRTGVHPNTAFGISFALDYARKTKNEKLEKLLVERSLIYYAKDKNYDSNWEPSGEDFFSPSLMEADLMRKVLAPSDFKKWFSKFLKSLSSAKNILMPAVVTDRTDPKLVHLDGLNLSRAWCMNGIANGLPKNDPIAKLLLASSYKHANAGLSHITSGNYEGEHWLASFAVYMLETFKK
jgi:hypothetical protein